MRLKVCWIGLALVGCAQPIDQWCTDPAYRGGAMDRCPDLTAAEYGVQEGCGAFDRSASSGGFSGSEFYFSHRTGDLAAVHFWSDTGDSEWYGRRISCDSPCSYVDGAENQCPDDPP